HGAPAGRQDGADQQQLGVAPRPLLQEHRREGSDEGGEAGWQAWHGGVSRRGCASLSLPRAPPASRPRPPLGRPPNLPPNGQSRDKGLPFETIPWRFTEKDAIAASGQGLV